MAAMLAALLPFGSANAQTKRIELSVKTLDHSKVVSAKIYAGESGTNYFVDSTLSAFTGTAVNVNTLSTVRDLVPTADGFSVQGDADSTTYGLSFIVVKDSVGRTYLYGDLSMKDTGIVRPAALFASGSDTLRAALTAPANMPIYTTAPMTDNNGWLYTSLAAVAANPSATAVSFTGDVVANEPVVLTRELTVSQNGHTLTNNCAGDLFDMSNNASLNWVGGNGAINTTSTTSSSVFMLTNAVVSLGQVNIQSTATVVSLNGTSLLATEGGSMATTSSTNAVIMMRDGSMAAINNTSISGGLYAASMTANCTGTFGISDVAVSALSGYDIPINAYGYAKVALGRQYFRSIDQASSFSDTVYLGRKMVSPVTDSISHSAVLMLGTDSIMSSLKVKHTSGTVTINGGVVNDIEGDNANGTLVLDGIDSVGSLSIGSHATRIVSGRYHNIATPSAASLLIEGGKFEREYTSYLASGHTFMPNSDADSASFHYTVVPGYKVRYKNYDYKGNDTVIAYNNADHKISPRLSSPRYTDTIFIEWFKDSLFTSPWMFLDEELTQDTTLYAKWQVKGAGQHIYKVFYDFVNLDGTDTTVADSVMYAATAGDNIAVGKRTFIGRETSTDTIRFVMPDSDTTVHFVYDLRPYVLTWNAGAGHFSDGSNTKTDTLKYTQPITMVENPAYDGHTFLRWTSFPVDSIMIARDLTVNAVYDVRVCQITWSGDTSAAYTAEPISILSATYKDDDSNAVQAVLTYYFDTLTDTAALKVGTYRVVATPQSSNYTLDENNNTRTFVVTRAIVSVDVATIEFDSVKFADYSRSANVTNIGTLTGVLGSDMLTHNTVARYSDAEAGENKPIVAYFTIDGQDTANYRLDTNAALLTANGVILDSIRLDIDTANNGIAVNVEGYCSGSDTIFFFIESGSPDEYILIFSDDAVANQHFTNNGWTAIASTTPGYLLVDIPADAAMGSYPVGLAFRNSNYPDMPSDTFAFSINVNLPKTYTMPLFDDVIALVDTCHCFTDIQWYHNGVAIEGANDRYYQEVGGLTGEYYVIARMNGTFTRSCTQDDVTTLIADEAATEATVNVYPNPTAARATVNINGSNNQRHTLRVLNMVGVTMEEAEFEGDNTTVDFSNYSNGSYTISIDGIAVRVIKK